MMGTCSDCGTFFTFGADKQEQLQSRKWELEALVLDRRVELADLETVTQCVDDLRGLLIHENTKMLSLGHLIYQEFLCAKYLARDNPVALILRKIHDPWWNKILRFYASLQRDITSLLNYYLNLKARSKSLIHVDLTPF
jgi:hypothetical protein